MFDPRWKQQPIREQSTDCIHDTHTTTYLFIRYLSVSVIVLMNA